MKAKRKEKCIMRCARTSTPNRPVQHDRALTLLELILVLTLIVFLLGAYLRTMEETDVANRAALTSPPSESMLTLMQSAVEREQSPMPQAPAPVPQDTPTAPASAAGPAMTGLLGDGRSAPR